MAITQSKIRSYLWYGYVPPETFPEWVADRPNNLEVFGEYSPDTAYNLLCRIFDDVLATIGQHDLVAIPLSSGWDSRLLLGMALHHFQPHQIRTITFGMPGNLDFDIARSIASEMGTDHLELDLNCEPVSWAAMTKTACSYPWTYMPDAWINSLARSRASAGVDRVHIMSGFLGDPLTGGHKLIQGTERSILRRFANGQSRLKDSKLTPLDFDPIHALPEVNASDSMPFSQKLDLGIRQIACISPIVTGACCWNGWSANPENRTQASVQVHAPFADPRWVAYWLKAPSELLRSQKLYLELLASKFGDLYKFRSKNDFSLPRALPFREFGVAAVKAQHRIRRSLDHRFPSLDAKPKKFQNYFDFNAAFRERSDYRQLAEIAIEYLSDLSVVPWIDLDRIYEQHLRKVRNLGDELQLLVGLAANIAAEREETST